MNTGPPQASVTDPRAWDDRDLGNDAVAWEGGLFLFSQGSVTKAAKVGTRVEAS